MIELSKGGAYLLNGTEIIEDGSNAAAELSAKLGNAEIGRASCRERV